MKSKISINLVLLLISFSSIKLIAGFTVPTQNIVMCTPGSVLAQTSPSGGVGPFSYKLVSGPIYGQVSMFGTGNGRFEYSLNPLTPGITLDTVKILVTDSLNATGLGIINFDIMQPITPTLEMRVCENTAYTLVVQDVLAEQGFNFGSANFLGYSALFTGARGTFTPGANFAATGTFTYTPNRGFTGPDVLTIGVTPTYVINGVVFNGCQLQYDIINNIINGPSGSNINYKTCLNSEILGVLPFSSTGVPPFVYSLSGAGPQHASSFNLLSDGEFTYFPTTGFVGTDSFNYFITDATGCSNASFPNTATLEVGSRVQSGVVNIEACPDQSVVGTYKASGGLPPYTYFVLVGPSHGTVTPTGITSSPTFLYQPDFGYIGTDNFTYTVTDSAGCGNETDGTVNVVIGVTALPVSLTGCQGDIIQGTFNASGGAGTYILYTVATNPSHGSVTSSCGFACSRFSYSPNPSYVGSDSFTYYVQDVQGCTGPVGTVSIFVDSVTANPLVLSSVCSNEPVNGQLVATGGTGNYTYGIKPTQNSNLFLTSAPITLSQGTITAFNSTTGSFTYQFTAANPATETFYFAAFDSLGCLSNTASVQISPTIVPQVSAISLITCKNGSTAGTLIATGGNGIYNFTYSNGPNHGTLNPFNATTGMFTYNATAGFSGQDTFSYRASSNGCTSNPALVTITIQNINAPVTQNLILSACENGSVIGNFTASGGSGNYQYTIVSGPTAGTVPFINSSTGEFVYQAPTNFTGTASFVYDATDEANNCVGSNSTVTITVGCS